MAIANEQQLFEFLREKYYPDLMRVDDKFSKWDAISATTRSMLELKCRRTHYPDLLLEKKKFDSLSYLAAEYKMLPYYVCSTPKGVWRFDLLAIDLNWLDKMMPATTDFANNAKIVKEVTFIKIEDGVKLDA